MFACLELAQLQSVIYQYCEINLRAALSEGGGRMWPPGRQLPTPGLGHHKSEGLHAGRLPAAAAQWRHREGK